MSRKLLAIGAAAAVVLGGVAVAQTTGAPGNAGQTPSSTMSASGSAQTMQERQDAPTGQPYGGQTSSQDMNASGAAGVGSASQWAGERG